MGNTQPMMYIALQQKNESRTMNHIMSWSRFDLQTHKILGNYSIVLDLVYLGVRLACNTIGMLPLSAHPNIGNIFIEGNSAIKIVA